MYTDLAISVWKNLGVTINGIKTQKQWCNKVIEVVTSQNGVPPACPLVYEVINLAGKDAYKAVDGRDNVEFTFIYIPYKDYVYKIRIGSGVLSGVYPNVTPDPNSDLIHFPISQQILSTFKFL